MIGFTRAIYSPKSGRCLDHVTVDEAVIQLNDEIYSCTPLSIL